MALICAFCIIHITYTFQIICSEIMVRGWSVDKGCLNIVAPIHVWAPPSFPTMVVHLTYWDLVQNRNQQMRLLLAMPTAIWPETEINPKNSSCMDGIKSIPAEWKPKVVTRFSRKWVALKNRNLVLLFWLTEGSMKGPHLFYIRLLARENKEAKRILFV